RFGCGPDEDGCARWRAGVPVGRRAVLTCYGLSSFETYLRFAARSDPLHARKMTALMQAATGGDKPILLKYDTKSGSGGGKPLNQIDDDADWVGFLLDEVGADRVKSGANGGS